MTDVGHEDGLPVLQVVGEQAVSSLSSTVQQWFLWVRFILVPPISLLSDSLVIVGPLHGEVSSMAPLILMVKTHCNGQAQTRDDQKSTD